MTHHLILGGARSGKSSYAEQCALQLSDKPIYIATAHAGDNEMSARITKHKTDRSNAWHIIEEPSALTLHSQMATFAAAGVSDHV